MSTRSSVAVILICGFTSQLLLAQAPPAPPKPGPEHKKLEYFVGKWTVEGEIKANEFVPAGKIVSTETCTLGPGGFYVECLAEGQLPTRLAIIAYDSHAKVYTSYYANSGGLVGTATGSVNGNTWTWMVEDKFAGKAIKGRTTVTMSSPTQYTSKYEMADEKGGGPQKLVRQNFGLVKPCYTVIASSRVLISWFGNGADCKEVKTGRDFGEQQDRNRPWRSW